MKNDDAVYPFVEELRKRVSVMRELGVTKWGDIELAPELPKGSEPDTQQSKLSPEAEELRRREQQRRLAFRTSGGPVKRLDVGEKQ